MTNKDVHCVLKELLKHLESVVVSHVTGVEAVVAEV